MNEIETFKSAIRDMMRGDEDLSMYGDLKDRGLVDVTTDAIAYAWFKTWDATPSYGLASLAGGWVARNRPELCDAVVDPAVGATFLDTVGYVTGNMMDRVYGWVLANRDLFDTARDAFRRRVGE